MIAAFPRFDGDDVRILCKEVIDYVSYCANSASFGADGQAIGRVLNIAACEWSPKKIRRGFVHCKSLGVQKLDESVLRKVFYQFVPEMRAPLSVRTQAPTLNLEYGE